MGRADPSWKRIAFSLICRIDRHLGARRARQVPSACSSVITLKAASAAVARPRVGHQVAVLARVMRSPPAGPTPHRGADLVEVARSTSPPYGASTAAAESATASTTTSGQVRPRSRPRASAAVTASPAPVGLPRTTAPGARPRCRRRRWRQRPPGRARRPPPTRRRRSSLAARTGSSCGCTSRELVDVRLDDARARLEGREQGRAAGVDHHRHAVSPAETHSSANASTGTSSGTTRSPPPRLRQRAVRRPLDERAPVTDPARLAHEGRVAVSSSPRCRGRGSRAQRHPLQRQPGRREVFGDELARSHRPAARRP